jgi:hypothetical protein
LVDEVINRHRTVRPAARVYAEIATCVACGATTVLVPTADSNGRERSPLDAEPDPEGPFVVRAGRAHALLPCQQEANEVRYHSHFASCPFTARFRR